MLPHRALLLPRHNQNLDDEHGVGYRLTAAWEDEAERIQEAILLASPSTNVFDL